MKKRIQMIAGIAALGMLASAMTGCGAGGANGAISVITREDGSGTRGAFTELCGIVADDKDNTVSSAEVTNSTAVMLTTVAGNSAAIGYVSMGSLDDSVKAVKVDGVEATPENVSNSSYSISRPFNIATNGTPSEVTQDFINYILSEDGQKIVEENGYIKASDAGAFKSNGAKGKIVVAGSSSVSPVMEKLMEAYKKVNTGADVELQESDSTTGMKNAIAKTCDIGMASRDLKDSETSAGLKATVIAKDGITVVVNKENSIDNLTKDQVNNIYRGKITTWGEVK